MNEKWSLDILYKNFEDTAFLDDVKKVDSLIEQLNTFAQSKLKETHSIEQQRESVKEGILLLEQLMSLQCNLCIFCSLRQSADTTDKESVSWNSILNQKFSETAKAEVAIKKYIARIDNLDTFVGNDNFLKEYLFLFQQIKEESSYLLSDEVEEVICKLNISGGNAWEELQQYLTSTVSVDYKGKSTTLSAIRNLAYSADAKVRKAAYEAELSCYEKIKDSVAYSLNSIKLQVLTVSKLRGFSSPLDMTLFQSRMKRETLEAMITAIQQYLPKFHEYLKAKGKLLGHEDGLAWYDLFAPVGQLTKTYTVEEAKDYLITIFDKFAPDLKDMVERAFNQGWIDFYPRQGKVGGAFCCNLHLQKQSRILTNFDGSFGDIVTLAHELGHAYHNQQIYSHRILNADYPMPVAETASTFNETVIMNRAIADASESEKLTLIENRLQDVTQTICDIYSRYLFETEVFENRTHSFLFPDELNNIMINAQKKAYGDGIISSTLHPYMWLCKSHYYSTGISFYNFPYAFGTLFARGLYAKYEEEGESFLPKYRQLLYSTCVCSVEDAAKLADIDLTNPEFFEKGLQSFSKEIDEFISLTFKK